MIIKILGSGTILSAKRNPSGYLIKSQNKSALIDCGPGMLKQLTDLNIDSLSLSAIFISHFHIDHSSDVLPVLMRRYLKNRHINKKLTIFGPLGLKYWYKTQETLHGSWFSENKPRLIEMHKNEIKWADLQVETFPTLHLENSIAYKFTKGQKSFFYGSDTDYEEGLVSFAANSNLAIIECSHRDENPVDGHLTPEKSAKFINTAAFEQCFLTHIYPENDTDDLLDRVRKYTNRNVQIASDLMDLKI